LWLAAEQPDRVASLGLVGVSAHLPPAQAWWDRAELVRSDGTKALSGLLAGKWFSDEFRATCPATVAEVLGEIESTSADGYAACCEAVATMDLRAALPAIAAPTVVIVGDDDPSTPPAHSELIADQVPHARLRRLAATRHLAGVERADEVTGLLAAHLAQGRVR
jgi:3-oxoadipate enol-lactonase